MADETKSSKKGSKKKASSGSALAARIGLYALLAVAVGVVLVIRQDRVANNGRAETMKAVDAVIGGDDAGVNLLKSQLSEYVVGDPEIGEPQDGTDGSMQVMYTWSGPFKSYSATVHFDHSDDPRVLRFREGEPAVAPDPDATDADDDADTDGTDNDATDNGGTDNGGSDSGD